MDLGLLFIGNLEIWMLLLPKGDEMAMLKSVSRYNWDESST